jgi:predicted GH43/DUF377 family glycosyl hydrolase
LTAADWHYPVNSVFNAGATLLPDGTTLLLCRVEDRRGHSHLCAARSTNGVDGWRVDAQPTLPPDPENWPEEIWGVEDPRITYVPELGRYAVVYTSYSRGGPGVSLALTEDFETFERYGVVMQPEDKDAALLPHRIGGNWAMIHRPVGPFGAHIWISYSPDLRHWGSHKLMLEARRGAWWDANKIGLSPPPIETPEGWLLIYHGVRMTPSGCLYRLGLALFDLATPEQCLLRGDSWQLDAIEAGVLRQGCGHGELRNDAGKLRRGERARRHERLRTARGEDASLGLDRRRRHRQLSFGLKQRVRDAAAVADLQHDAAAAFVHRFGDGAPSVDLPAVMNARGVDVRLALRRRVGHLGDDEAGARTLRVVGRHDGRGDPVGAGAIARHRRHDHPVREVDVSDAGGREEWVDTTHVVLLICYTQNVF